MHEYVPAVVITNCVSRNLSVVGGDSACESLVKDGIISVLSTMLEEVKLVLVKTRFKFWYTLLHIKNIYDTP